MTPLHGTFNNLSHYCFQVKTLSLQMSASQNCLIKKRMLSWGKSFCISGGWTAFFICDPSVTIKAWKLAQNWSPQFSTDSSCAEWQRQALCICECWIKHGGMGPLYETSATLGRQRPQSSGPSASLSLPYKKSINILHLGCFNPFTECQCSALKKVLRPAVLTG